ncbi:feruloyl-CoA synthase [Phaeobacter sp. NW0010-22]|uniref:feruloyl-CoA synthase n=1 Tax=Phaeobacter sp. NW0010-22 TaxID=3135907 RepID=UPI00310505B8
MDYVRHNVLREDGPKGEIFLRSGYEASAPVSKTTDWLHHWASERPNAIFLAERSGPVWREVHYGEALERVRALAAGLVARGMGPDTRILILSGNGIDHGLLSLAAQYVGVPTVPVAEPYSLVPDAQVQLKYILELIEPTMVFAEDGAKFASALALDEMQGREIVVSQNAAPGMTQLSDLTKERAEIDPVAAKVGPETVAKILMTSGSTSNPKGVLTSQRMMCTNQAMYGDALPALTARPPVIVDWLPWNHVFGGSFSFNQMLAFGGSLYIDGGKPAPALIGQTIENLKMVPSNLAYNVPVGFALLRDAMREDAELRAKFFADLDLIFYAGASLPRDVWDDLRAMCLAERGDLPLVTTCWGLTETAPACIFQHGPLEEPGVVGVPLTGTVVKLVPEDLPRFEVRVKGPNVFSGYYKDPEKTVDAFDGEGYFCTGDAMTLVDPDDMSKGLRFDGRISEDFKLSTGIWVRAASLRLEILVALASLAADVVITGADRDEVGVLIFPTPAVTEKLTADEGILLPEEFEIEIASRLAKLSAGKGSSARITRAIILAEPPSMAEGEITAKGNLNFRKLLSRRADILTRLYAGAATGIIIVR